jgi:hypothetical protein
MAMSLLHKNGVVSFMQRPSSCAFVASISISKWNQDNLKQASLVQWKVH